MPLPQLLTVLRIKPKSIYTALSSPCPCRPQASAQGLPPTLSPHHALATLRSLCFFSVTQPHTSWCLCQLPSWLSSTSLSSLWLTVILSPAHLAPLWGQFPIIFSSQPSSLSLWFAHWLSIWSFLPRAEALRCGDTASPTPGPLVCRGPALKWRRSCRGCVGAGAGRRFSRSFWTC